MSASPASLQNQRIPDPCAACEQADDGSCPQHPAPKLSKEASNEYIASKWPRYRKATRRREKIEILDDICRVTPYHRDTIKRKLNPKRRPEPAGERGRPRKYTEQDDDALLYLREVARFIDARGLKSQLPSLIEKVESGGHRFFDPEVKKHLAEISPRTIDRRLNELGAPRPHSTARPHGRRRGNYEASLRVRKWWEWDNEPPGSVIADHVYHSGSATGGAHCYTLTVVDAATSWTSPRAIERLDKDLVASSMDLAYRSWPLPIHAVHTDHGTEFANDAFGGWVERKGIEHTLGRPRQSNDQARVEQRNNTAVRLELADYRFTGRAACEALNDYYTVYRLYLNFFRPVRKLAARGPNREKPPSRFREPATPYELMLASGTLDAKATERLARIYKALDPVRLNEQIDKLLRRVMHYAG